jgi:hypothetical protein
VSTEDRNAPSLPAARENEKVIYFDGRRPQAKSDEPIKPNVVPRDPADGCNGTPVRGLRQEGVVANTSGDRNCATAQSFQLNNPGATSAGQAAVFLCWSLGWGTGEKGCWETESCCSATHRRFI